MANEKSKSAQVTYQELVSDDLGMPNDALTGHEYDGIQEFDNPLPGWWKWLFVGSMLFAFPYYAYYHFGATGRSVEEGWAMANAANSRLQFATIGELKPDRQTLVKFLNDKSGLGIGKSVYKSNCVSCHGSEGGGLVGPNLTDENYKNINTIEDIVRVINVGAGAGAMPAWQNRLDQNERILVACYVASLRGTQPGGSPKGPEGKLIAPWPTLEQMQNELGTEPAEDAKDAKDATGAAAGQANGDAAPAAEPAPVGVPATSSAP